MMAINGLMEQLTAIHQLKFSNQLLIGYGIWVLSILALAGILAVHFQRTSKLTNVPILLSSEIRSKRAWEYYHRARELLRKGYEDHRDKVFAVDTNDGLKYVIPPRFLNELQSECGLSFKISIDNDMLIQYTMFGGPPEYVIRAMRGKLNASLPRYVPILHEILKQKMPRILGEFNRWTPVKVHNKVLKLTGALSARVIHSAEASQSDEWIAASTGYVQTAFETIVTLKKYPPMLRPLLFFLLLRQRAEIKKQWAVAHEYVAASIEKKIGNGGALDEPRTMLDHLITDKKLGQAGSLNEQLRNQMILSAVGTLTTFNSVIQCLYDLSTHPEYIAELRDEVSKAQRDENGHFTKESLRSMRKLDSFLKESQRLSSPDLSTFQRAATVNITLSDGTLIPKGAKLECATSAIHTDERNYEDPETFDGLRFYRKMQIRGEENKHLFVSVGGKNLAFGYGRHICPGRYVAHIIIMLMMAEVLLNYDVKNHEGQGRPKNVEVGPMVLLLSGLTLSTMG